MFSIFGTKAVCIVLYHIVDTIVGPALARVTDLKTVQGPQLQGQQGQ